MFCLKCGKETGSEQVFCNHCLESMEKYPVKPGARIHLPNRDALAAKRPARRPRAPSAEDTIRVLRRKNRLMAFCVILLSLLLIVCAYLLFWPTAPDIKGLLG